MEFTRKKQILHHRRHLECLKTLVVGDGIVTYTRRPPTASQKILPKSMFNLDKAQIVHKLKSFPKVCSIVLRGTPCRN
eukprot:UN02004